jgi:hypothetical protein
MVCGYPELSGERSMRAPVGQVIEKRLAEAILKTDRSRTDAARH